MEDYDDPSGPPAVPFNVEVKGQVDLGYVTQEVVRDIRRAMETRIDNEAASAVEEALCAGVRARVVQMAEDVLANGWEVSDDFGRKSRSSVQDRVMSFLSRRGDYGRGNVIEEATQEALRGAVSKMVNEEVEKARVAFRATVDGILQAKLADVLRGALGLK